jgi:glutamyl-tRNA synthetase
VAISVEGPVTFRPDATVRVRFAPSPTGLLHAGGARTALFNWLFARGMGGDFILRIDDTDAARSTSGYEAAMTEDLGWLGLDWDESPEAGGPHAPYRQSERLEIYSSRASALLEAGMAYRCFCSIERLEGLKRARLASGLPPMYDGLCRGLAETDAKPGVTPVIRYRVSMGDVEFTDAVHGRLVFSSATLGDFIIIASDGTPSYNFATAVDDSMMGITHVIRGDDHIPNTPRQILLCRALGHRPPVYCHIPLVLGPERMPLGKREGAGTIRGLREAGFMPLAVVNAIARLGWSTGEGLLTLEEMSRAFSLEGLSRSPSVFDPEQMKSFGRAAMRVAETPTLLGLLALSAGGALPEGDAMLERAVEAAKPGVATVKELLRLVRPFAGDAPLTAEAASVLSAPGARPVLRALLSEVEKAGELDEAVYAGIIERLKAETGEKGRGLFMPIRCALTGDTEGIELKDAFRLLGRTRVIERLRPFAAS